MKLLDVNRLSENIARIAEYDISRNKVFGAAYLVCQEETAFEVCYGSTSLDGASPVTNRTVFRLASMTKPITALATLILVERGLLSLDDNIDRFLPNFKNIKICDAQGNSFYPEKIPTIRNILTHTSGIGSIQDKLTLMTESDNKTLDSAIEFYLKIGLDFEPGSAQCYSGVAAFDVLTKIIENIAETDYLTFLKKEIFLPCDMQDTTFVPTIEQRQRMVKMHNKTNGNNAEFEMQEGCVFENIPETHYLGGAGLVSTLYDYGNFAKMLLNKGQTANRKIVDERIFQSLCTPLVPKEIMPGDERWGLGVRIITEDSYPYLPKGSFGWSGAYGSHFWIDPQNKIFAVFMKNSKCDGGSGNQSARKFEEAVYSSF